jgi:hypothetical protein
MSNKFDKDARTEAFVSSDGKRTFEVRMFDDTYCVTEGDRDNTWDKRITMTRAEARRVRNALDRFLMDMD